MILFTALVIGALDDITSFASEDPQVVRRELIEFHNQAVLDGGLDDEAFELEADTPIDELSTWISGHLGRSLVFLDIEVLA